MLLLPLDGMLMSPGFKIAAGTLDTLADDFSPKKWKRNAIPSLDRQNQRPWNVIVSVSHQKVMHAAMKHLHTYQK